MDADSGRTGRLTAIGLAVAVAVAGFVAGIVVGFVAVMVLTVLDVTLVETEAVVLNLVVLQGIGFPLTALLYVRLRGLPRSFVDVDVPDLRDVGWIAGGYVLALGIAFSLLVLIVLLQVPTAERADQAALQNPDVLLVLIPLSFLLIGPGEELLFRGIIQGTLRQAFGAPLAIVLASAMFAPAHILALVGGPMALLVSVSVLFFPSLVFGAAYEYTENIVVPSLIHGAYNATIFGLVYLSLVASENGAALL